jgi:hypothetical protein
MSIRLSSFLTDIERGFKADDPSLKGGTLEIGRTLNYNIRLARLALGTRTGRDKVESIGTILLQAFDLANGTTCLKASLFWTGHLDAPECVRSIFERPGVDWEAEASQIASTWLAGPPAAVPLTALKGADEQHAEALAAVG